MSQVNRASKFHASEFESLDVDMRSDLISKTPFIRAFKDPLHSSCVPEGYADADNYNYEALDVLLRPKTKELKGRFIMLQQWKGAVLNVQGESFLVELQDLTNKVNPKAIVELDVEEVPLEDRSFIESGAIFYWSVGYSEGAGKPRTRESRIRFRRLPNFSDAQIHSAQLQAASLENLFRDNQS